MTILLKLFLAFLKIGVLTFGGGYAMIPLIQEEAIANGWMSTSSLSLVDYIAISESTPGPFAINIATFIGMNEAGILGAIVATVGVVLPSFVILMLVARFFARFSTNDTVKSIMKGVRPVVVGILLAVMISFTVKAIFNVSVLDFTFAYFDYKALIIFTVIFVLSRLAKKISPVFLIVIAAGLGILLYGVF